jgi:hypothetical protein
MNLRTVELEVLDQRPEKGRDPNKNPHIAQKMFVGCYMGKKVESQGDMSRAMQLMHTSKLHTNTKTRLLFFR